MRLGIRSRIVGMKESKGTRSLHRNLLRTWRSGPTSINQTTLRERLFIIIPPRRPIRYITSITKSVIAKKEHSQIWITVSLNVLIDISSRGVSSWITTYILLSGRLVYPYPIDRHDSRENEMFQIDRTEVCRHTQISDDVLRCMSMKNL